MPQKSIFRGRGYSLTELLVVIAIIGIVAAIAYPVFLSVRENGRRASCLANQQQLAKGILLYLPDHDDHFPSSNFIDYPGVGWAGAIHPYTKSFAAMTCPSDGTTDPQWPDQIPVSYGLNCNLSGAELFRKWPNKTIDIRAESASGSHLLSGTKTVLFFEVEAVTIPTSGADQFSPSGNTVNNPIGPPKKNLLSFPMSKRGLFHKPPYGGLPLYATGNIGGRVVNEGHGNGPRHGKGANYTAADGHALWLRPEQVSGGADSVDESCLQGRETQETEACRGQAEIAAEGTAAGRHTLTFSKR